jgi:hypothetical protein
MTRLVFLSYATGAFTEARDMLCQSALNVGFSEALACGPDDLDPAFRAKHAQTLLEPRGAGYWIWKPQIIIQTLKKLGPDDILVYSDAGRSSYYHFHTRPDKLIAKAKSLGFLTGVAIHQHGPLATWTKRDAFIRLGLDNSSAHHAPVIQATWSFWTPCQAAFEFLSDWRAACEDPACLTDQPNIEGLDNLAGFKDHRHDQSLSSLITHKSGAPYLDYMNPTLLKLFALRPQSQLAHYFLKRIADAESMEQGKVMTALLQSFWALKK